MALRRPSRWGVAAGRIGVITALLLLWELAAGGLGLGRDWVDPLFFSRPSRIVNDLYHGFGSGEIHGDLLFTLQGALGGLILGIVTGVAVGFLFAYSSWIAQVFEPIMVALNSLPRPALAPVLPVIFGLGLTSKIVLSWSIVFFVMFYNSYWGVRSVDAAHVKMARVMGAGTLQVLRLVVVPSVFSWVFAALRVSVAFSLRGAIVGEFVGSTQGLGYQMLLARGLMNTDRVYSILFVLMFVGVVLTSGATWLENRLLRWRPTTSSF